MKRLILIAINIVLIQYVIAQNGWVNLATFPGVPRAGR